MKELTEMSVDTVLSAEERNLLSVAYKNVVGARRSSWRVISTNCKLGKDTKEVEEAIPIEYLKTIEKELEDKCKEIIVSFLL